MKGYVGIMPVKGCYYTRLFGKDIIGLTWLQMPNIMSGSVMLVSVSLN